MLKRFTIPEEDMLLVQEADLHRTVSAIFQKVECAARRCRCWSKRAGLRRPKGHRQPRSIQSAAQIRSRLQRRAPKSTTQRKNRERDAGHGQHRLRRRTGNHHDSRSHGGRYPKGGKHGDRNGHGAQRQAPGHGFLSCNDGAGTRHDRRVHDEHPSIRTANVWPRAAPGHQSHCSSGASEERASVCAGHRYQRCCLQQVRSGKETRDRRGGRLAFRRERNSHHGRPLPSPTCTTGCRWAPPESWGRTRDTAWARWWISCAASSQGTAPA